MDRAGNNGVAIKSIQSKKIANPTFGPCHSHTNNLPGKEFNESCKVMHQFRKSWNKGICTRGQMHNEMRKHLGKYPVIAGGGTLVGTVGTNSRIECIWHRKIA